VRSKHSKGDINTISELTKTLALITNYELTSFLHDIVFI
jgi:hypothetical protein